MDDQIDFPVADGWRDHYAAQGLTYAAGRRERRQHAPRSADGVGPLLDRLDHQQRTIDALTAEIARLSALVTTTTRPRLRFEGPDAA
jgi:hypothetical protein